MSNIKLSEEHGEVRFGLERYPVKEELIIKQKVKVDASQANLAEFKARWLARREDEKLYDEMLSLYSELVLELQEATKLCDAEREDPKKVRVRLCSGRSTHRASWRS